MDKDTLWSKISDYFKSDVSRTTYSTWVETAVPIKLENNELTIELPSPLHKDYWKDKLSEQLIEYAYKITKKDIFPKFVLKNELSSANNEDEKELKLPTFMKDTHLNPEYTFDTFVIGKGNQMAHAAALVVSEDPGKMYNPLLLYGGVGLGKTHLMHAIGNKIVKNKPDTQIKYVTSESFTNDFINAIQSNHTERFRQEYRNVDVLLVDDIQFFADKDGTQEEFFHTFNDLYEDGKQIVLTSDRLPNEISKLQDRLVSRFAWGLSVDITAPDLETRIAILKAKADNDNMEVPVDILNYIAGQIDSNVRELEGALSRVQAFAKFKQTKISKDLVSEALHGLNNHISKLNKSSVDEIIYQVANYFELEPEDIKGKKRTKAIVIPRQIAMYLSRKLTNVSLPKIGISFGGKDHTTVIHAYDKINVLMKKEKDIKAAVKELSKILGE
ncbi:chromosomal replication initiator protein DnaA [Apilactobacillus xinyiensis]|uniref:chromosomal replication initiator protein DnaA n=1 Tax=Apilactobacillus xinyiensis TaxID=2841032 RepID=UPI0033652394